jgi:hypothetical protein
MKPTNLVVSSLAGAAFAAALVIACSDDSPSDADAAVCDCPAAEPPLQGRITVVVAPVTIPANAAAGTAAQCPQGATLLGGGCRLPNDDAAVLLSEGGPLRTVPTQPGYDCYWVSTSATARMGEAEAICLMPAQ